MIVGKKIKRLRKLHNLTQGDLADRIGISPSAMCRYENGKRQVPFNMLQKIALILCCDLNYFHNSDHNRYTFIATNLDSKSYNQFLTLKHQIEQIKK